jgi:ProP effector
MSNPHLKLIMQLAEKHPKCFSVLETRRKPLKIGIHHDLHATGEYDSRELSNALRYYCCNPKYLLKCSNGVKRVDLDGNPCGEVTQQEAAQ